MIGYAKKKIEKIIQESAFDKKKEKFGLKFNPGLALTRVRTTRPLKTTARPHSCVPIMASGLNFQCVRSTICTTCAIVLFKMAAMEKEFFWGRRYTLVQFYHSDPLLTPIFHRV